MGGCISMTVTLPFVTSPKGPFPEHFSKLAKAKQVKDELFLNDRPVAVFAKIKIVCIGPLMLRISEKAKECQALSPLHCASLQHNITSHKFPLLILWR